MGQRINSKYLTHDGIKWLKKRPWTLGCAIQKNNIQVHQPPPKPHEIKAVVPPPWAAPAELCLDMIFVPALWFQAPALQSEQILLRPPNSGERHIKEDAQQERPGLPEGSAGAQNPPKSHISLTWKPGL